MRGIRGGVRRSRGPLRGAHFDDQTVARMPLTHGIAGHVAQTGEVVNIPDAYRDSRFNRSPTAPPRPVTPWGLACSIFVERWRIGGIFFVFSFENFEYFLLPEPAPARLPCTAASQMWDFLVLPFR